MSGTNGVHDGTLVPRRNKSITLRQAAELTPPTDGVGEFARALQLAAFNGITEQDMSDMMAAVMKRAKEGDPKAIKFVLDFVGGGVPPAPQVNVHLHKTKRTSKATQQHTVTPKAADPDADLDDDGEAHMPRAVPPPPQVVVLRRFAARVLAADGPTPAPGLAGQLGVAEAEMRTVLDCDWFKSRDGKVELTPAGRQGAGL